jgi:hypothetical protein
MVWSIMIIIIIIVIVIVIMYKWSLHIKYILCVAEARKVQED